MCEHAHGICMCVIVSIISLNFYSKNLTTIFIKIFNSAVQTFRIIILHFIFISLATKLVNWILFLFRFGIFICAKLSIHIYLLHYMIEFTFLAILPLFKIKSNYIYVIIHYRAGGWELSRYFSLLLQCGHLIIIFVL